MLGGTEIFGGEGGDDGGDEGMNNGRKGTVRGEE